MSLAGVLSNGGQTLQMTPKSTAIALQTSTHGQSAQVLSSPTQIRFTGQQTFVTNHGQILGGNPTAIVNQFGGFQALQQHPQQGIPLGSQGGATILTTQPLYLRPAIHTGLVGNVQAVAPTKGKQPPTAWPVKSEPPSSSPSSTPLSKTYIRLPSKTSTASPVVVGDAARVRVHHPKMADASTSVAQTMQAPGMKTGVLPSGVLTLGQALKSGANSGNVVHVQGIQSAPNKGTRS